MGLDICRFIEVKSENGDWHRLKFGKDDGVSGEHASHFGYGRTIAELILDDDKFESHFEYGIPEDSQEYDKEIYKKWGYKTRWIKLSDLDNLYSSYEDKLFEELKSEKYKDSSDVSSKLDAILAALGKQPEDAKKDEDYEEYYPEYPWEDKEVTNSFEDKLAMGLYRLYNLSKDLNAARGIVDMTIYDYVYDGDVRIIYVYNN